MIEVRYYYLSGAHAETVNYDTTEQAFKALVSKHMEALIHPVGTTSGGYHWRPCQEGHTLEGFKAKMDMCCNDPGEYSQRLAKASLVKNTH